MQKWSVLLQQSRKENGFTYIPLGIMVSIERDKPLHGDDV